MRNRDFIYPALFLLASLSAPAHAYIDPSSGSAIMSAIIGFFVAVSLAVKTYWYKLKSLFSRSEADNTSADADEKDPQQPAE